MAKANAVPYVVDLWESARFTGIFSVFGFI
jgi:hypothetical protein